MPTTATAYNAAVCLFEDPCATWDTLAAQFNTPSVELKLAVHELLQMSVSPMLYKGVVPFDPATSVITLQKHYATFCLSRIKAIRDCWFDVSAV